MAARVRFNSNPGANNGHAKTACSRRPMRSSTAAVSAEVTIISMERAPPMASRDFLVIPRLFTKNRHPARRKPADCGHRAFFVIVAYRLDRSKGCDLAIRRDGPEIQKDRKGRTHKHDGQQVTCRTLQETHHLTIQSKPAPCANANKTAQKRQGEPYPAVQAARCNTTEQCANIAAKCQPRPIAH